METKKFDNVAKVIRLARQVTTISQNDLAKHLGYKNGQFVSNIERGICSIPPERVAAAAKKLGIQQQEIINAAVKDFEINYSNEVKTMVLYPYQTEAIKLNKERSSFNGVF